MANNKKPRKKYRPGVRQVLQDPVSYVVRGVQPAPIKTQAKLRIDMHRAFTSLTGGAGTVADWCVMSTSINMARALCSLGCYQENTQDIAEAMAAHDACGERFERHGRFGYSGTELNDVRFAMTVHEHQLMDAPIIQLEEALRMVEVAMGRGTGLTICKKFSFTREGAPT
jgi:hypothetical protein